MAQQHFTQAQVAHNRLLTAQIANLKDVTRVDWQVRTESLQKIQTIVDQAAQDPNLSPEEKQALLHHFFSVLQSPLKAQLVDLRQTVSRETIVTLVHFAKVYPSEFSVYSAKFFSGQDGLLKLLNNAKRLISDMAHEGIVQILNSVYINKAIEVLAIQFKNKNSLVRLRIATYFEIIIKRYDIDLLIKSLKVLETDFLLKGIEDQAQEVRKQVRICWKAYSEVEEFGERVAFLIKDLRGPAKKQLQQELASKSEAVPVAVVGGAQTRTAAGYQTSRGLSARKQQPLLVSALDVSNSDEKPQAKQLKKESYSTAKSSMVASASVAGGLRRSSISKTALASPQMTRKKSTLLQRSNSKDQALAYMRQKYLQSGRTTSQCTTPLHGAVKEQVQKQYRTNFNSRCNTPGKQNQSMFSHNQSTITSNVVRNKGVKHVIANLDESIIDHRPVSSCDTSILNMTGMQLRAGPAGSSMNTSRMSVPKTKHSSTLNNTDDLMRQKYTMTARRVRLNLEKPALTTNSQSHAKKVAQVPAFSKESMQNISSQKRLDTAIEQVVSNVGQKQPIGPASGRINSYRRGSSLNSDRHSLESRFQTAFNGNQLRKNAMTSRNRDQAAITTLTGGIQRVKITSNKQHSHSFNKYHSMTSLRDPKGAVPTKINSNQMLRMAVRFQNKNSAMKKNPLMGTNSDLGAMMQEDLYVAGAPCQTEVQDDSNDFLDAKPCFQPLMTEEVCGTSQKSGGNTILFNSGKGQLKNDNLESTLTNPKMVLTQVLRVDQIRQRRKSQVTRRSETQQIELRPRSISQYLREGECHQQLIDTAVTNIQQEKINMGASTNRESSNIRLAQSAKKRLRTNKSVRLIMTPRATSRKSRPDTKSVMSMQSEISKPDSPYKLAQNLIEKPSLPSPIEDFDRSQSQRQLVTVRAFNNPESPPVRQEGKQVMISLGQMNKSSLGDSQQMHNMSIAESDRTIIAERSHNFYEENKLRIKKVSSQKTVSKQVQNPQVFSADRAIEKPQPLQPQNSQRLIKLVPVEQLKLDFQAALGHKEGSTDLLSELKACICDPHKKDFWRDYANEVVEHIQEMVEDAESNEDVKRQLNLIGKILIAHVHHISIKMKGILLDKIFSLLRDNEIQRVPSDTFSVILSTVRNQNLGWRFFIDSINKLDDVGEADEHFFVKALSIAQGHFRQMSTIDLGLLQLFIDQLLTPNFENESTIVRKQVVLTFSELKFAMEVRLQTQSQLLETSFDLFTEGMLNSGRQKLVQIYFERLVKEFSDQLARQATFEGHRFEESSSSEIQSANAGLSQFQTNKFSDSTSSATIFTCKTNSYGEQSSTKRRGRGKRFNTNSKQINL